MWLLFCVESVQRNALTASSTSAEVEAIIKTWLRRAPDRNGGRSRRAEEARKRKNQTSGDQ